MSESESRYEADSKIKLLTVIALLASVCLAPQPSFSGYDSLAYDFIEAVTFRLRHREIR